jgi:membrane fusion protein (multidrug efflux system)
VRYQNGFVRVLAVGIMAGFIGCAPAKNVEEKKGPEAVPVGVIGVATRDFQRSLNYVGNIRAQEEAVIYSKVDGKVIEKVKEEGAAVAKGDTLLLLDRDEVGLTFEKAPVETPLAGMVGRVYVDVGARVTPATPIALVVAMDQVKINLDIPEKYLPGVALAQEADVMVDAYPGEIFRGKVVRVSPVLDMVTRTAPIEIQILNEDHRLKSGMFAKVKLVIGVKPGVTAVLKEAVMGRGDKTYVYVVENGAAVLRQIKTGAREGAEVEVVEGLAAGDRVVVMGQQKLYEGAPVAAEERSL